MTLQIPTSDESLVFVEEDATTVIIFWLYAQKEALPSDSIIEGGKTIFSKAWGRICDNS